MQSISIDDLSPAELQAALAVVEEARARTARNVSRVRLLESGSDGEIIASAKAECWERTPITLANRYSAVDTCQEISGWCALPGNYYHPRRPVFMRGARWVRVQRNSLSTLGSNSPNGWAAEVFWRAIRRAKLTAMTQDEYEDFRRPLAAKLHAKYRLTSAFGQRTRQWVSPHSGGYVVGGKLVWLRDSEAANVKALLSIIRKADTLERRMELARAHMRARLSL